MKSKTFLTLYARGGIGNQLFQYSAAYAYSKKYCRTLLIDINGYYGYKWNEDAGFLLNQITPDLNIIDNPKWEYLFNNGIIKKTVGRLLRKIFWQKGDIYKEKELFIYDFNLIEDSKIDGLYGSFQSPKYFKDYVREIINVINLPILSEKAISLKNNILMNKNSVAIHFRDYSDPASGDDEAKNVIGELDIKYYLKAIDYLDNKLESSKFYVFSNNIKSAKSILIDIDNLEYFDYKSDNKWEDMALMSLCGHNIICNSSYSWWAAFLNKNPNKIVIAPKSWGNLLKGKENNNDLFPEDWILF